ncbi:MAG: putative beta-lysine N-acetyltransferase [Bacteroidota bacterium]
MNDISVETKSDIIEEYGNSIIHHGKQNNRIYLLKYDFKDDQQMLLDRLIKLAKENGYTKIISKVPAKVLPGFLNAGFHIEAYVPGFYYGTDDGFFMAYFLTEERGKPELDVMNAFQEALKKQSKAWDFAAEGEEEEMRLLKNTDVRSITELYTKVFKSYPFPIHEEDYVLETMKTHVDYYGIFENGELIAVSSAEKDPGYGNAEMTDFAVNPDYRGRNLAGKLLHLMENELRKQGVKTAYTIARLHSIPMNVTFLKSGYRYSGTLVRNTNISGAIESMNVLYKSLI